MSSQPLKSTALEIYMQQEQTSVFAQTTESDHLSVKNPLADTARCDRSWWSASALSQLKERVPGLDSGLYEEVWRQIESLFDEAMRLAEQKRSFGDVVERALKKRCPGLGSEEYQRVFSYQLFQNQNR